ncbi:MAG: saccharopine dehydrogenase family protein [Solirubrobacterales bacterium]
MASRIVCFGATGFTGRLIAEHLVGAGAEPLLAGRDADALNDLASELGGLETQVADVDRPESVAALVREGDVLVTTVGPFAKMGGPAIEAAIGQGATYIDSTGEPSFIRDVFEGHGARASAAEVALLTAFGFDYVPGNLAGAMALEQAGNRAVRVDVGYFGLGGDSDSLSGGTKLSMAGVMLDPQFAYRGGSVGTVRGAERVRSFELRGKDRQAFSLGGSEHFALPRLRPELHEVNVFLGSGPMSKVMQGVGAVTDALTTIPGARSVAHSAVERVVSGSTGGPDAQKRAEGASHIVAIAYDRDDHKLAEVHLNGSEAYTFTAGIISWAARQAADGAIDGTGALGPVEALGLDELRSGAAEAGLAPI